MGTNIIYMTTFPDSSDKDDATFSWSDAGLNGSGWMNCGGILVLFKGTILYYLLAFSGFAVYKECNFKMPSKHSEMH